MFFLDANIFLEVELAGRRKNVCKEILRRVREGREEAVTTDFVLDSIAIIMERYGKSWFDIRLFLSSILGYKGLHLYMLSLFDRISATEHMRRYGLDFDDAMTYQAMRSLNISEIVSYDRHFDVIPDVKRIAPKS